MTRNDTIEQLAKKVRQYGFYGDDHATANVEVEIEWHDTLAIRICGVKVALLGCMYTAGMGWTLDAQSSVTTLPPSGFSRIFNRIADK